MEQLHRHIESLIFASEQSITLEEISASLKSTFNWELEDGELLSAIEELKQKYAAEEFSFEVAEVAGGFRFLSKKDFHPTIGALIQHKAKKKLSLAAMETLAIIAYRQPITKTEVEHIRGVNCDYSVQKLLEKELIEMKGKSDGPGKPMLYATSQNFMDYFGIRSVKDLPQLKDIMRLESGSHIGEIEDYTPVDSNEHSETGPVPVVDPVPNSHSDVLHE